MNEISFFLNRHSEIKRVSLLTGYEYTYEKLQVFLKDIMLDELIIITPCPEARAKEFQA